MITTNNEAYFIATLNQLFDSKLIYAEMCGNAISNVKAEIRFMSTAGGYQFGIAEIDYLNRRLSGIYTTDIEEVYLRAIDLEKKSRVAQWFLVPNIEHTPNVIY